MNKMFVLLGLCALVSMQAAPAQTQDAAPATASAAVPVQDFFRTPQLIKPVLSPDGRYLAAAVGNARGRLQLAVLDLQQLSASKVVASFSDADVNDYHWVNPNRLVLNITDRQSADRPLAPGMWAVNRDGSDFRQLIKTGWNFISNESGGVADRKLSWEWRLHSTLSDGSPDVLVVAPVFNSRREVVDSKLARLNTQTGRMQNLTEGAPEHVTHWVVDREGSPAAVSTWFHGRFASYLKTTQGWQLWEEAEGFGGRYTQPYWIGAGNKMLVLARRNSDTSALYEVDRATLKLADQPTVSTPGYDFNGSLVYDAEAKRLMGVHFETDGKGTAWFDKDMNALQAELDKLLPGSINRIDCERCASVPTVLVSASADRLPPTYYLYQRESRKLERVAASRPWIRPEQMGQRDMYRFTARDGMSIPLLVTQPAVKSDRPRPAVCWYTAGPGYAVRIGNGSAMRSFWPRAVMLSSSPRFAAAPAMASSISAPAGSNGA